MTLSRRAAVPDEPSPEHARLAAARARTADAIDLTPSNPSEVGLVHPPEVYAALGDPGAARYEPAPFAPWSARAAVVDHDARRDVEVTPERVWLTASTSEAYAQLMLLSGRPGDGWWVPRSGYPLLEALACPLGIELRAYSLGYLGRWGVDLAELAALVAAEPRSRAIVAVAPGNPTGAYLSRSELDAITSLCAAHDLAFVVDEVFSDYPLVQRADRVRHVGGALPCATFVLSGLSKVAALPQMKLGWVVAHGPRDLVAPALARVEHLADAFLSVATPVQLALPTLLAAGDGLRPRILARLQANLATLARACADAPLDVLDVEGGWIALVRLPAIGANAPPDTTFDDVAWACDLCEHARVVVQPGYLYDLASPPRVAVSLLTEEDRFAIGVRALVRRVTQVANATVE